MRKLLMLLVLVSGTAAADSVPQNGRYAVSDGLILDTRTGKAWQTGTFDGSGAMKYLIPLKYIGADAASDIAAVTPNKKMSDMIRDGNVKLTVEPPQYGPAASAVKPEAKLAE